MTPGDAAWTRCPSAGKHIPVAPRNAADDVRIPGLGKGCSRWGNGKATFGKGGGCGFLGVSSRIRLMPNERVCDVDFVGTVTGDIDDEDDAMEEAEDGAGDGDRDEVDASSSPLWQLSPSAFWFLVIVTNVRQR